MLETFRFNQKEFLCYYQRNLMEALETVLHKNRTLSFDTKKNPLIQTVTTLTDKMLQRYQCLVGRNDQDPMVERYDSYYECSKFSKQHQDLIDEITKQTLGTLIKRYIGSPCPDPSKSSEKADPTAEFTKAYNQLISDLDRSIVKLPTGNIKDPKDFYDISQQ